jgi:hypothetical protein
VSQDDRAPDDGTPLHALAELRRAMSDRFDRNTAEVLHAVERAQSAVVQADSAKTVQEENRHLVRALAAAAESFILAPKSVQDAYLGALQRLDQQVATLVQVMPRVPPAPDQLAQRVADLAAQVDAFLSGCASKADRLEAGLTAQASALLDRMSKTAEALSYHARSATEARLKRDVLVLLVGALLGLLVGALVWRASDADRPLASHSRVGAGFTQGAGSWS